MILCILYKYSIYLITILNYMIIKKFFYYKYYNNLKFKCRYDLYDYNK